MTDTPSASKPGRELTGRTVLFGLIAFFGVVFGVNAIMIRFATQTFGGVETASSYKAGLAFRQEEIAAQQQDGRHWKVSGDVAREVSGATVLTVTALDGEGRSISGWTATARLVHPADARLDRSVALEHAGPDRVRGMTQADAGVWDLVIDIERGGVRAFRSRSRIVLR